MTTIAGDLVRAFGDVDTMQQMYADDIVWQLPAALGPAAGPHRGKDAVLGFNTAAWSQFYRDRGSDAAARAGCVGGWHAVIVAA